MGKNIILLSDGTGNGAAKRHKTNVWRLYDALDLHQPDQIAFYDDGVGSQEFKLFKLLGGAFGWGLKRNVLDLYKFLCRNYQPDDRIYLFGFSRGAFTVRVLVGMIDHCGVYKTSNESDLDEIAKKNYSAYRFRFKHGYLYRLFRWFIRANSEVKGTSVNEIEFVGVWDTVDAYGFPIDEIAILWDRLIFPIRFPDRQLSTKVNRACHAISIDDERHTFHPVLWDEKNEIKLAAEKKIKDPNRLEQVWFPGVHSDVGGGYPRYVLSLVTLDWMISKVEAINPKDPNDLGLRFISTIRKELRLRADWNGAQHDSRSGFAAYYRYKPRKIKHLCDNPRKGVKIEVPKIHRSVFERIRGNVMPYAPIGIPESYEVVATRGKVPTYVKNLDDENRCMALRRTSVIIFLRRWLYALLLATTLTLVASRFFLSWSDDGVCSGPLCFLDPILKMLSKTIPDLAMPWFHALRQNPFWLWGFFAAFVLLSYLKHKLLKLTESRAAEAWAKFKAN